MHQVVQQYNVGKAVTTISSCQVNSTSRWVIKQLVISFGSTCIYFCCPLKVARGLVYCRRGKCLAPSFK